PGARRGGIRHGPRRRGRRRRGSLSRVGERHVGAFAAVGAWPGVLARLVDGEDLPADVASAALDRILAGEATDAQIAGFLIGLRAKGEAPEEVAGLVEAMLAAASPLELDDPAATVDIVGTGGSVALGGQAFNVST